MRTHYDVLGVPVDADATTIRTAYRDRARVHHPDHGGGASAAEMSAINEAYRVLGDAARRASYDLQLRSGTRSGGVTSGGVRYEGSPVAPSAATAPRPAPGPPARIPWKLMAVMATIGIAVVLIGAATRKPATERPPDGVVGPGSCVVIESNGDAREVNCSGAGDLVVAVVVAFDATCPGDTGPHRDRQGLGIVCVIPEPVP